MNLSHSYGLDAYLSKNHLLFLTFLITAFFGQAVWAAGHGRAAQAKTLTESLTGLNNAYQRAAPPARARALDDMIEVAEERHAVLAELMENDPGAVLQAALPQDAYDSMPAQVQDLLEQRLDLEGELEVFYEDYSDGTARVRQFLRIADEHISLHFQSDPPGLISGALVSASGVLLDDAMAIETGENTLRLAAKREKTYGNGGGKGSDKGKKGGTTGGDGGGSNGGDPAPGPSALGPQKTLVILVNFPGDQGQLPEEPYDVDYARGVVFGTASDFFWENSNHQTWLTGVPDETGEIIDVIGWYTIPVDGSACVWGSIEDLAQAAAAADGVDLSAYDRLVYAYPKIGCSWWGLSTVGGNPSQTHVNGDLELHVVAHEMGHAMGLWHSHALNCGDLTLGPSCETWDYGDIFDKMGSYTQSGHFNSFQKERLGWLDAEGASPTITTVSSDGTYLIRPHALAGTQEPKALKILKSTDPNTGERSWYYVESRQAVGFDQFLANYPNALNGVLVHSGSDSDGNSSYLLDMNAAESDWGLDWLDSAPLVSGQEFYDPESGVTITTDWVTDTYAEVTVQFEGGL